jgi:hypothetical protein
MGWADHSTVCPRTGLAMAYVAHGLAWAALGSAGLRDEPARSVLD